MPLHDYSYTHSEHSKTWVVLDVQEHNPTILPVPHRLIHCHLNPLYPDLLQGKKRYCKDHAMQFQNLNLQVLKNKFASTNLHSTNQEQVRECLRNLNIHYRQYQTRQMLPVLFYYLIAEFLIELPDYFHHRPNPQGANYLNDNFQQILQKIDSRRHLCQSTASLNLTKNQLQTLLTHFLIIFHPYLYHQTLPTKHNSFRPNAYHREVVQHCLLHLLR